MTSFSAIPAEIRLVIYEALFDDRTEQHYPHPMLETSEQITTECTPYLFRQLQLTIANPPPELGRRDEQWVAVLSSRKAKRSRVHPGRVFPWTDFLQEKSLSNWLPYIQRINLYFFGFQGLEIWIANVKIRFHGESSAPKIDFSFSRMHPAPSAMYRRGIESAIRTSNVCSVPLLRNLVNVLHTRETRSLTRKRSELAPTLIEEILAGIR